MFCMYLSLINVYRQRKDTWFNSFLMFLERRFCQKYCRQRADQWKQETIDKLAQWVDQEKDRLMINELAGLKMLTKVCDVCGFNDAKTYSFGCRDTGFWNVDLCSDHAAIALEVVLRYNDTKLNVNTVPRIKAQFKL